MEGFKTEQEAKISNNSDLIGTVRQGVTTNEAELRNVKVKMEEKERRTTDSLNKKVSEVEQKMVADMKAMNEKMAEQERRTANMLNEKVSQMEQRMGAQEEMFENFKTEMLGKLQEQEERIVAQEEKSVEQDEKIAAQGITISAQEETIAYQEGKIELQDVKNAEQEEKIARQSETILKQEEMIQNVTKYAADQAFFVRISNTGPRARDILGIALIIIIHSFNTNAQALHLRLR